MLSGDSGFKTWLLAMFFKYSKKKLLNMDYGAQGYFNTQKGVDTPMEWEARDHTSLNIATR